MTNPSDQLRSRRFFLISTSGLALLQLGCGGEPGQSKANTKPFKMGDRATVGVLTYNILESTYLTQLGAASNPRMPENRFLVLRVAVTNGGGADVDIPLLSIEDESGKKHQELQNGDGLQGWFGIIRKVAPTSTEEGRIIFDVPPRNYKLLINDGGETGQEHTALIEIPMDFDTAEPVLEKK